MKFIEVVLNGGLGNQLFQYATARALMKKYDFLFFKVANYTDDYLGRKFKLFNYNIKGAIIKNKFLEKAFTPNTKGNILLCQLNLYSLINENGFFIHNEVHRKTNFFTRIEGFWQSEIYFKRLRKDLLKEFVPKFIPTVPEIFSFQNTVGLHIRRTDFLDDSRYGFVGEKYYWNAIDILRKNVVDPTFIVFSDDVNWCKRIFKDEPFIYAEDFGYLEDYIELYLMSKCKHQIISNSSFSWWGAWLNEYPSKLVIRPIKPFNDPSLLYEQFYPSNWIAI